MPFIVWCCSFCCERTNEVSHRVYSLFQLPCHVHRTVDRCHKSKNAALKERRKKRCVSSLAFELTLHALVYSFFDEMHGPSRMCTMNFWLLVCFADNFFLQEGLRQDNETKDVSLIQKFFFAPRNRKNAVPVPKKLRFPR